MQSMFLFLFLMLGWVSGVQEPLPKDADGKVSFEEQVMVTDYPRELLLQRAQAFVAGLQSPGNPGAPGWVNSAEGKLRKAGGFYVYKKGLLTPQLHGEIQYTLYLRVGEGKYTYTFTDFSFQYYQKNRYGQYEPISGKKKALEEEHFAGHAELWKAHKASTREHIQQQIKILKSIMEQAPEDARLR